MQRTTNDTAFIKDNANRVIGVNLGWDFTTEHECGICPLIEAFGLPLEEELGFEARRNTKVPHAFLILRAILQE
ncbi:MAG: hypothetical protein KJ955_01300 [Nanoarchaeota archaeon]|nr:hypothetical protein [Nanoarchaeota archaeon]